MTRIEAGAGCPASGLKGMCDSRNLLRREMAVHLLGDHPLLPGLGDDDPHDGIRMLDLDGLESDYGVGVRFGTINGVFLRVEGAFGSREGKHFILRWGHVF